MEQIVARGRLVSGSRPAGYALIDETTGETVYALRDPRGLLEERTGDLVQVHGTLAKTGEDTRLLEVTRVD